MGSTGNVNPDGWASEPIAIVGMSAKYAGEATHTDAFWRMLVEGRSGWTPFPASRFRPEGVYHPNNERLNSTHVKGAHFLEEDVGLFDAAFFSYSSETASSLDPQYRLQLESVYEALENAGLPLPQIAGSNTSVFTGVFVHDYRDGLLRDADNLPRLMATGTGVPMMSNRISHFFDLRGASMTIETACSSSMVAIHQAVQSLRTGEADMSIVGGANLTLNPDMFKALGSAGFLSADGKSYAFDSRASGYGRGEGVATLVIKRLTDALAAGDPIRAVIRESFLNQDGKTETITTPSLEAQEALIRGCYRKAGLDPRDTQYFEAHGTGTQAGDTIEARAIGTVFAGRSEPLLIGSVKTNVGHTEAASGLASIIKTVLAMETGIIPPSINFEKPNPKLSLEEWNLRLVRQLEKWPETPIRRASINNFGYGGTNSHIILEESAAWVAALNPSITPVNTTEIKTTNSVYHDLSKVLILSGKDEQACQNIITNLQDFLEQSRSTQQDIEKFLDSLIYTLDQKRTRFPWVAAYPVPVTEGIDAVIQVLQSPKFRPRRSTRRPRVGMVFTGQGAQWHAMGRELVDAYPVYRASLEEAAGYLKQFGADWSLIEELSRDAASSRINEVGLSTPICVAVQISLVRLLQSWGIVPVAVTSHSSGEIAAAYTVGALSYRAAMAFSYYRAVLAADTSLRGPVQGGMVAVGLGLEETKAYLERLTPSNGPAVVACVNSPSSITVAGDVPAVLELEELATADGVFARRLKVDVAWHSHHMAPIANVYVEALERMQTKDPASNNSLTDITFSSPVTGGRVVDAQHISSPKHWVESLVQPVQFVSAFTDMVIGEAEPGSSNIDVIVEVGPHTALGGPIQQILALPEFQGLQIPYYGCLVRKMDARETMQTLAASLLQEGYPVDLKAVNFAHGISAVNPEVLTDLPAYPWNHQVKHWVEPRFNRALRERSLPPHDLLGALVEGCNPQTPAWRHVLRIAEAPWTRDHVIQSNVVYPAAGYMCLAIEAIRQLTALDPTTTTKEIAGYKLRNVDFLQALVIPDGSDGIEIQTTLRPVEDQDIGAQGWKHFEVWTVTADNRWTHHARGLISIEFYSSAVTTRVKPEDIKGYTRRVLPNDLFANLRALGISHGPMFQNMKSIVQSGAEMRSAVTMAVADTTIPNDLPRDPVLHPVTLDSIITAPYSAVPGAAAREVAAKVPRAVQNVWVSSKISHDPGHLFTAHSALLRDDSQGMAADVCVSDHDSGHVVLEMKGFSYQSLGRNLSLPQSEPWENQLCNRIDWSLDISMPSPATWAAVKEELSVGAVDPAEEQTTQAVRRACLFFMQQALQELDAADVENMKPPHARYYAWMKATVQREEISGNTPDLQQIATRVDGEVTSRLGPHLASILRGQTTALELLNENNLLSRFYRETPWLQRTGPQVAGLLRHLAHKNPRARILEIGAGTGAMTHYALEALGSAKTGGPNAALYHFTDVSEASFDTAREDLQPWSDLLAFDVLDIEQDPATQGFTPASYDVVIVSQVLHATKSISGALEHVRSLLRPGATLLLLEDVQEQVDVQFVDGLLSGGWHGEELQREISPLLSTEAWNDQLRATGFSGVDLTLGDIEGGDIPSAVTILSTVPPSEPAKLRIDLEKIVIVTSRKAGPPPATWLENLQTSIAACTDADGSKLPLVQELEALGTAEEYADKICIFLGEIDEPILYDLDTASLDGIRAMGAGSKGLLWVTRGGAVDCERPELGLAPGFVRSLRNEYVGRKLLTLDLDPQGSMWSEAGAAAIVQVLQTVFGSAEDAAAGRGPAEFEYAEREGVILVPRLYHDVSRNQLVAPPVEDVDSAQETRSLEPFLQTDRPLCWHAEALAFGDDSYAQAHPHWDTLPPSFIEVDPRAYGTSMRGADGQITGLECAGIITRLGSEAAAQGYAVGDRVCSVLRQSSFASRALAEWTATTRLPDILDFQAAASLPIAFLTAYFSLVETARVRRGQSVLVHAAAGAVGQAAVMIAQHLGAVVFATAETSEDRDLLAQSYGIPEDHIFSGQDTSFGPATLAATGGRGVDVVLNSLTGALLQESFNLVAPLGHFIEIGTQDFEANSKLEMRPFARQVSFSAVDIPSLLEHRAVDVHRYLGEVMRLVEARAVKPVHPITSFALGDIVGASRLLQTGTRAGKVVLSVDPHAKVPVRPHIATAQFSPDASYLIVGGNGGLGQSVAHWMVTRGARNLVLLSRSAATSEKTAALAQELWEAGCDRVLPVSCDVASEDDLAQAIQTCADEGLPPIRGVIHAAFVLHDSFVEKMTLDDYKYTTQSKIAGTWNLHNQFNLPGDLDFFVLFSSINGILGYASQAAYSAAGAYEDALAHWRSKHCNLPGVSIDLSVVNAVGYVAAADASETLRKSLLKAGRRVIDEDHVLRALESAILAPLDPQFVVGGINSGPGSHWDDGADLMRDLRVRSLQYRAPTAGAPEADDDQSGSLAAKLGACATRDEAVRVVGSAMAEMLAEMFLVPVEDIDLGDSPSQQGIDSLVAVEVRNMLFSQAAAELSIFNIMQSPSLAMLAADVVDRSKHVDFAA